MQAMIFSAGLGTRLYPITRDKPKALAPFLNETLLSYNLKFLANQGVDHFVINTHHFAELIEEYLIKNEYFGFDIDISNEKVLLDTAGGIGHARKWFKKEKTPILFYNVDVISDLDLKKMILGHLSHNSQVTLAVRKRKTSRYLLFDIDHKLKGWRNTNTGQYRPEGFRPSGEHEFGFSGIQLISGDLIKEFEGGRKYSLIDFYLEKLHELEIFAYQHDTDYWFDCGKPSTLSKAEKHLLLNDV